MRSYFHPQNESVLTPMEWEKFDFEGNVEWMDKNWHISLAFSALYILLIHWGQQEMKNRPAFKLNSLLFWWNVSLSIFSIMGFLRIFPELQALLGQRDGLYKSVCSREQQTITTAFWCFLSTASKVVELFDTGFIVLRKQRLIFLHWYHHTTVLLFAFYTYPSFDPLNRWMIGMNYFIHGVMYGYYALKAMKIRLPRVIALCITTIQILQMVLGVTLNLYTLWLLRQGVSCARKEVNVYVGLAMYFSYMILFGQFFYSSYVKKGVKTKGE